MRRALACLALVALVLPGCSSFSLDDLRGLVPILTGRDEPAPPVDEPGSTPHGVPDLTTAATVTRPALPVSVEGTISATSSDNATAGSAHGSDGPQIMGSDGTLARRILTDTGGRVQPDIVRMGGEAVPGSPIYTRYETAGVNGEGVVMYGRDTAGKADAPNIAAERVNQGPTPRVLLVGGQLADDTSTTFKFSADYYLLTQTACRLGGTEFHDRISVPVDRGTFDLSLEGAEWCSGACRRCIVAVSSEAGLLVDDTSGNAFLLDPDLGLPSYDTCTTDPLGVTNIYIDTQTANGFNTTTVSYRCWE